MGMFSKLFGGSKESTVVLETVACAHATLLAHWDSVADMGNQSKATSFSCEACAESFTPAEAQTIRSAVADRMKSAFAGSPAGSNRN